MRSSAQKPSGKGKTVSFIDGSLQPENMDMADVENSEDMDMALVERLRKLERELFDYQYNMGLLLIERKEWIVKHEELQQSFVEVVEVLKRERASHLIKASRVERREANSRKALDVERQCATKNRSLDVQEKMIVADRMLSAANRKSLELDRKFLGLETHESVLRREIVSFNSERNAHEAIFLKDKEDMKEGERKLQDVDEREEKVNGLNRMFKYKERELVKEDKTKAEYVRSPLEMKEKELIKLTEKLNSKERESVEIQKLMDEHRSILERKRQVFELEIEEKRKLLDEEMKVKHDNLDRRASEMNHMEEKSKKQEQTLERKSNKIKAKEKDVELKMKDFKEKEKSLKVEEKHLELLRSKVFSEKESLQIREDELEKMKAKVREKEAQIRDQIDKLRITDAEKNEHIRLRMELKQEIKRYNRRNDLLLKESEDLKQDRKKFEEEWEILDEKREQVNKEKIMIEKLKLSGENQLKEDKLATDSYIKRELESLRLEKESFDAKMKDEYNQLLCDFETRKWDLEADIMYKQEEMERNLWERERKFINERSRFLAFVETLKNCQNCGDISKDYVLSDLDVIEEQHPKKAASHRINNIKTKSSECGGRISWLLKKCTPRIFNLSPNIEEPSTSQALDTIEGNFEAQEHLEDSQESELSHHLHKSRGNAANIIPRKRSRPQLSRRKGTEDTDDSEWLPESESDSESDTESSCSKRRQIDASAILNASETRYNLRQHRTGGKAIASSTESDNETDNVGDATLLKYDEITSAPSGQVSSDNGTSKTVQTQTFPINEVVKTSSADIADITDDVKSTEMKYSRRRR